MSRQLSLFEKLGKMNALEVAVGIFYNKVKADASINHFFEHTDMYVQKNKMKAFLAVAFGAEMNYDGLQIREAHAFMNLTEEHFNTILLHLSNTLKELKVQEEIIKEVNDVIYSYKSDVINQ